MPAARNACGLCGMPRSVSTSGKNSPAPGILSSSPAVTATPPFRTSSQAKTGTVRKKKKRLSSIACPACTFLNHPSLKECEICGTTLQTSGSSGSGVAGTSDSLQVHFASKSAPSSRPASPEIADSDLLDDRERYIRLSFRKGGDKSFYAALKTALQQKGWEVSLFILLILEGLSEQNLRHESLLDGRALLPLEDRQVFQG